MSEAQNIGELNFAGLKSRLLLFVPRNGEKMEHFDIVQWADFVRGLPGLADRTAMEEHLSSGRQRCAGAVRQLRKLVAVAGSDARYKVPDYAVDYVKAIYPLQQPAKVHILAHTHTRLIHDSFREPLPAGIRSQGR